MSVVMFCNILNVCNGLGNISMDSWRIKRSMKMYPHSQGSIKPVNSLNFHLLLKIEKCNKTFPISSHKVLPMPSSHYNWPNGNKIPYLWQFKSFQWILSNSSLNNWIIYEMKTFHSLSFCHRLQAMKQLHTF